jgi:hypothetical protein
MRYNTGVLREAYDISYASRVIGPWEINWEEGNQRATDLHIYTGNEHRNK